MRVCAFEGHSIVLKKGFKRLHRGGYQKVREVEKGKEEPLVNKVRQDKKIKDVLRREQQVTKLEEKEWGEMTRKTKNKRDLIWRKAERDVRQHQTRKCACPVKVSIVH